MSEVEYVPCVLENGKTIQVKVVYDSLLMRIIRKFNGMGGITIRNTIRYYCGKVLLNKTTLIHELQHVRQWNRLGVFGFLKAYLKEQRSVGYDKNSFEQEARKVAGEPIR